MGDVFYPYSNRWTSHTVRRPRPCLPFALSSADINGNDDLEAIDDETDGIKCSLTPGSLAVRIDPSGPMSSGFAADHTPCHSRTDAPVDGGIRGSSGATLDGEGRTLGKHRGPSCRTTPKSHCPARRRLGARHRGKHHPASPATTGNASDERRRERSDWSKASDETSTLAGGAFPPDEAYAIVPTAKSETLADTCLSPYVVRGMQHLMWSHAAAYFFGMVRAARQTRSVAPHLHA